MNSHSQQPDGDDLTPNDIHDGSARRAPTPSDEPMGSHLGAVSTEVSPVTPVASNVAGEEPSGVEADIDLSEEFPGG